MFPRDTKFGNRLNSIYIVYVACVRFINIILLATGALFFLRYSEAFSRAWLITWTLLSTIGLIVCQLASRYAALVFIRKGSLSTKTAIVGATDLAREIAAHLANEYPNVSFIAIFDHGECRRESSYHSLEIKPISMLMDMLSKRMIDEVIVALPQGEYTRLLALLRLLHPFPVSVYIPAPAGLEYFRGSDCRRYGKINTLRLMKAPMDEASVILKWVEDKLIAGLCLTFLIPLMFVVAVAIKWNSPGPIFFKQKRLGENNRIFDLLKFRSMYCEQTDLMGHELTRADDPRVTRVGRFLRRTSIDELPQLINVLRGDMSLVGPRPHPLAASAGGVAYAEAIEQYLVRHRVRPGITGWAQVNGWRGETKTIDQLRHRVEHDLFYIENWSLGFDLYILFRTVLTVASQKNAF